MPKEASVARILKNDYASLLMLMLIGVTWVLAIGGTIMGQLPRRHGNGSVPINSTAIAILFGVAVVVTLTVGWLATKRIANIQRTIQSGLEVPGRILAIDFFKDRGRIEYEYQHNGQSYQAGNAIWKNGETTQLKPGDEITLIVNPDNPTQVYLATLYT